MDEPDYVFHPKYEVYSDILDLALKPECYRCPVLDHVLGTLALNIIKNSAILSPDESHIVSFDPVIEKEMLAEAQQQVIKENGDCKGIRFEDYDAEAVAEKFKRMYEKAGYRVNEEKLNKIPLQMVCGQEVQD